MLVERNRNKEADDLFEKCISFLRQIGLSVKEAPTDIVMGGFISHIKIQNGEILFTPQANIGDMLHEAAHVAIIPEKYRAYCQIDMGKSIHRIYDAARAEGHLNDPDSPISLALINSGDDAATAYAWALGMALGIPPEEIIPNHEYDNDGESIRFMLINHAYSGIHALRASGMIESVKNFPAMIRWTQ